MEQRLFRESRILCVILRERNPHRPSHQLVRVQRLGSHQIDRKCVRLDGTQHVESHRTSNTSHTAATLFGAGRTGDRRENPNGTRNSNAAHDISLGVVVPWVIASTTSQLTLYSSWCCGHHVTPRARLLRPTMRFQPSSQDGRSCFSGFPIQAMKKVSPAAEWEKLLKEDFGQEWHRTGLDHARRCSGAQGEAPQRRSKT